MYINKKISAFTLSEMIVVLILTSVVVAIAFTALDLVQKHMLSIQHNYANNNEFTALETSLWLDFNRFHKVKFNVAENELQFISEMDSLSYIFYDTYIIKRQDTFHVSVHNKLFYFTGKTVIDGHLDAIKLTTTKKLQHQQLFVFKTNDASVFME